jgi:excisionase family DNA binding protein
LPANTTRTRKTEEDHERLLTVRKAAPELGIGLTTCYRLCSTGELPVRRIGGSRRVRLHDLEAYIESSLERCP